MLVGHHTFDQPAIYVRLHIPPKLIFEHLIHQPLISGTSIFQAKRYDLIAIGPLMRHKRGLLLILLYHPDLMIPREGVHEAQQLVPRSGVDELVYV